MKPANFNLDLEDVSLCLSCAIKTGNIMKEEIEEGLIVMEQEQKFMGTGYLMDCCDGFFLVLRELERIREDLDAAVLAGSVQEKEG